MIRTSITYAFRKPKTPPERACRTSRGRRTTSLLKPYIYLKTLCSAEHVREFEYCARNALQLLNLRKIDSAMISPRKTPQRLSANTLGGEQMETFRIWLFYLETLMLCRACPGKTVLKRLARDLKRARAI